MSKLYSAVAAAISLAGLASIASAQEAPCDASTQACLNVMMANTCFAAYIRGNNVTEMLRCVNVSNQTLAREEVRIYSALLVVLLLTHISCAPATDAPRRASSNSSPAATSVNESPAAGGVGSFSRLTDPGWRSSGVSTGRTAKATVRQARLPTEKSPIGPKQQIKNPFPQKLLFHLLSPMLPSPLTVRISECAASTRHSFPSKYWP